MSGTKVLWGQIVIVGLIVVIAVWAATEWVAWRLGFQTQLGAPWFEFGQVPIYLPPSFFWWWFSYDAYARSIFQEAQSSPLLAASCQRAQQSSCRC